ncbi:MAG: DUF1643 domain-containing protein [Rhodobacteraceae bacterium]|nr:DUF1643 domain-containing protein [Paracoccaceae bacterium]
MIVRRHEEGGVRSKAVYSGCETYRYLLARDWGPGGRLLYILLNPSTASELRNDPTVERCQRRARYLGFGGFRVANLFAFRATDPRDLKRADQPVGPENDAVIEAEAKAATLIVCGWGVHGAHRARGPQVSRRLATMGLPLAHLGLTRHGAPCHPLYVPYSREIHPWIDPPAT